MASPESADLARRVNILLDPPNSAIARALYDHMPLSQHNCLCDTNAILEARNLPPIDIEEMHARIRYLGTSGIVNVVDGNTILTTEGFATAQFLRSCTTLPTKDKG